MDKNNEKIFSCPKKLFPSPLSPVIQCCINPKSHYCTSKASPATLKRGKRMGGRVCKFCVIFLKNPFSWHAMISIKSVLFYNHRVFNRIQCSSYGESQKSICIMTTKPTSSNATNYRKRRFIN